MTGDQKGLEEVDQASPTSPPCLPPSFSFGSNLPKDPSAKEIKHLQDKINEVIPRPAAPRSDRGGGASVEVWGGRGVGDARHYTGDHEVNIGRFRTQVPPTPDRPHRQSNLSLRGESVI